MSTAGDLLERLDAYVNRVDPDYLQNRYMFLNAGHRWVERKFHAREALYGKWLTTDRIPMGVGAVPLPGCYRPSAELRVYRMPERQALTKIRPTYLREPFIDQGRSIDLRDTTQLGVPSYYAVYGRALEIRPLPAEPLDLEITGTGWADPMSVESDETVLTQDAPDAVLYSALREVWLFLGDEPQMAYWQTQAERAVSEWILDRTSEELPLPPPLYMEVPG
jgi:hypothetical protein